MKQGKFKISDLKEYWKQKYSLLSTAEITKLDKTKDNCSFEEWYEALQSYVEALGGDWERCLVTDCGEECWREAYNDGVEVSSAFEDGFME